MSTVRNNSSNKSASHATTCVVCLHPRCNEFDRLLALAQVTAAQIAREIGCHRSSVTRHKQHHLLPEVSHQVQQDKELADIDILAELKGLYRRMQHHLERAEKTDNWQAIRGFHAEARQDLEMLAKLLGDLDTTPQVNILLTPEWHAIRSTLMTSLAPFPDARISVAAALAQLEEGTTHHDRLN